MKYKLINKTTGEEHLCDKVTIDGFDHYVSDEEPTLSDTLNTCYYVFNNTLYKREYSHHKGCKKVIATNNPNIDIPKVVDEIQLMANEYGGDEINDDIYFSYISGYKKSQETHPFSENDMVEFDKWKSNLISTKKEDYPLYMLPTDSTRWLTTKELLQIWKEQQPKIVYYD